MMIAHAILLKIALIGPGGNGKHTAVQLHGAKVIPAFVRVLHSYLPAAAVRFSAQRCHIASQ